MLSAAPSQSDSLPRRLGPLATVSIVVGTVIGSGIFRMPAPVAAGVGSQELVALVWVLGGVISLCGALSLAELAAMFPRSGGVFVYLKEVYGDGVAFLFGWTLLIVGPAGAGALAVAFAEYSTAFWPGTTVGVRVLASALVLVVSIAAYVSVRGVAGVVTAASAAKVGAMLVLVISVFALGDWTGGSFGQGAAAAGQAHWGGVGFALVGALWAYNGFNDMVSVSGEVRNPGRVLPLALVVGMSVVTAIYLAMNAAYLYVLPFDALRQAPMVASEAMLRVVGQAGSQAVAAMVMTSTFGAVTGVCLVDPRVYYAMASEGLLFAPLARVHPRFQTPHVSVAVHCAIALVFIWWRSFEQLASAFVLGIWPFLALATAGVFVLRRRRPDFPRPYRIPGYPAVPLIFIISTLWVIVSAVIAQPVTTLVGMGLTLAGIPIYVLRK